jgi:cytochrome c peroxidase
MKIRVPVVFVAVFAMLAAAWWFGKGREETAAPAARKVARTTPVHGRAALSPLPPLPDLPPEKVALGKRLFFEKRLSRDNTLACAGCHDFARGGGDRMPTSVGIDGKTGSINAPTVFNASLNFVQFWDGRAASLEEQAAGPVHNPLEMASSWSEVIPKLRLDAGYRDAFHRLYPQGIAGETIVDAIATYERTLLTPNSRFDRYLGGDKSALDALELTGYRHFLDYGCASCHQGVLLGGNMYQRFGVMGDFFKDRPAKQSTPSDLGRFNVTGRAEDRHVFKVPGLRNVAVTAPYFHDGSVASLEAAVVVMGRYQLGRDLAGQDVVAIVAFLRTLTGEWEGQTLQ